MTPDNVYYRRKPPPKAAGPRNSARKTYSVMAFSEEQMDSALNSLPERGLRLYVDLKNQLLNLKINESKEYKNKFKQYYWAINMSPEYEQYFFDIFEKNKRNRTVCFSKIMEEIGNQIDDFDPFLCSNLVHTINDDLPVWNIHFIKYFDLEDKNNLENSIGYFHDTYENIKEKSNEQVNETWFENWKNKFNDHFNDSEFVGNFSNIKKLDLFFWKAKLDPYPTSIDSQEDYIRNRAKIDKIFYLLRQGLEQYIKSEQYGECTYFFGLYKEALFRNNLRLSDLDFIQLLDFVQITKWNIIRTEQHIPDAVHRGEVNHWVEYYLKNDPDQNFFSNRYYREFMNVFDRLRRTKRNPWAHQKPFNNDDIECCLNLTSQLISCIANAANVSQEDFWEDFIHYANECRQA